MGEFIRPCHIRALDLIERLDSGFLNKAGCYFGGGTRLTMTLGEYRESNDVDFLCSDAAGWRALKSTITNTSLGSVFTHPPELLREVRSDRDAIRTFVQIQGAPVKLEIIKEGNLSLTGETSECLPIVVVDQASSVAQKLLANTDRGRDPAFGFRDIVDIAVIVQSWEESVFQEGWRRASGAYGDQSIRKGVSNTLDLIEKEPRLWRESLSQMSVQTETMGKIEKGLLELGRRCGISCSDAPPSSDSRDYDIDL